MALKDLYDGDWVQVDFRMSCSLIDDPEYRFITKYEGRILVMDEDEQQEVVGHMDGYLVDLPRAINDGEDLFDLLDRRSELERYAGLLLDPETNDVKEELQEQSALGLASALLVLCRVEVLPAYRGRDIGLKSMEIAIQHLGAGCGVAVLQAYPLQFEARCEGEAPSELSMFHGDLATSLRKLVEHYGRLGFQPLGEEGYMLREL